MSAVAAPQQRHAEQVQGFRAHAGVFAMSMTVIFGVNLMTNLAEGIASSWSAWWSAYALLGWGLGLGIHGFVVWLATPVTSAAAGDQQPSHAATEGS